MVKERMDLLELLRKGGMDGDVDFLREALRVLVEGIMDAEVSSRTGAEYGERSPERVTQRNGYRSRAWDTRVGTTPQPFAGGDGAAQGLSEHPTGFQGAQYPSYHRSGHLPASIPYHYHQLVFPPAGVLLPQVQDCQGQLPRPGGLTEPSGPVAPLFQAPQVPGVVPSLPPLECLAADTEVATGQCCIAVSCVVVHPLQPLLGQPAVLPHPAYVLGTRSSRSYYFHDDTILSVTLLYEREHSHKRSRGLRISWTLLSTGLSTGNIYWSNTSSMWKWRTVSVIDGPSRTRFSSLYKRAFWG